VAVALAAVSLCSKVKRAANKPSATKEDQQTRRPGVWPLPLSTGQRNVWLYLKHQSDGAMGGHGQVRVPITNNVSRQMNRRTKIKLTNLNSKSKDVAAFHAKRGHVPGHGRVQFLAFALHLSDTQNKRKIKFSCQFIAAAMPFARRTSSNGEPLARSKSNFRMIATCSITVGTSITCCSLVLFILDILFVPGHCSESTFRNFFFPSNQNVFGLFIFEKKLIQPEQPAPEYGHGHSGGGDTDEREC
jgi:hypothetical protein